MAQLQSSGFIRFGVFEVEPQAGTLRKHGTRIRLQEQPFRVLLALLEKPGEAVSREALQQKVWAGTEFGDFDHSLNIAINKIRDALGDSAETPRYVETLPRRGYRFIAPVEGPPAAPPATAPVEGLKPNRILGLSAALALTAFVVGLVVWLLPSVPPPELQLRRLTNDNSLKFGPVLSDGAGLYFRAGPYSDTHILHLSLSGGEPERLPVILPPGRFVELLDITPDGQELLLTATENNQDDSAPLWTVRIADGSIRRVAALSASEARFSPDGSQIAFTVGFRRARGSLAVASSDGSNVRRLLELPSLSIVNPCWSPDGRRIAFGQFDPTTESGSTWTSMADGSLIRRSFPDWRESHLPAGWTPDGRQILVSQGRFWAELQPRLFQSGESQRIQLTSGQPGFEGIIQLRDRRTFYAVGSTPLGQLQRFDVGRREWVPHLSGISAETVEYSRDGKTAAYVTYPEGELWSRRADGSGPMRLAKSPMRADLPRWSPDGKLIAFIGKSASDQPRRIYILDAAGGIARSACKNDCGPVWDLSWAPDGKHIVYDVRYNRSSGRESRLMELDVDSGATRVLPLPDPSGLFSPRWSPDGSILAAMMGRRDALPALKLYRVSEGKWRVTRAPESGFIAYPSWSHDGKVIWYGNPLRGTIGRYFVRENRHEDVLQTSMDAMTGRGGYWFNLTPNDEPMILRRRDIQQIYQLELTTR